MMNKQFELLLMQAIQETGSAVSNEIHQRFAELIVKECAKLQHRNVVVGGVSEYNRGRREFAEDILKHFGVER